MQMHRKLPQLVSDTATLVLPFVTLVISPFMSILTNDNILSFTALSVGRLTLDRKYDSHITRNGAFKYIIIIN